MLRTLLSPRLVGLHLVTIVLVVAFAFLGRWQLGVFEESGRPHAVADPAPVALTTLVPPGGRMPAAAGGRRVAAQGAYDPSRQLLVAERAPTVETGGGAATGGDDGYWLLTPLTLADGTVIPVVRGWVPSPTDPATAVPDGAVSVTGRVLPPEPTDFARRRTAPLPAGQVATVSTAELVNLWRGVRLRDGFVVATDQTGAVPRAGSAVRAVAVPPPTESGGFTWRNLAYAAQWWIFAGFAVLMWFHFVRDTVRAARPGHAAGGEEDDGEGGSGEDGPGAAGPEDVAAAGRKDVAAAGPEDVAAAGREHGAAAETAGAPAAGPRAAGASPRE
ncbi:SURF1 family protein [Sphaerisporangium sp. NPDC005288]|uniref:SURF1 family protein n=1 Tax=Sphaerisporangium sp. NPDC005288 TaxID=3155114 RepID=UPI0033B34E67